MTDKRLLDILNDSIARELGVSPSTCGSTSWQGHGQPRDFGNL